MSEAQYDITDEVKRDVLAGTDLVSLIGAATALKKAGASWKGLCPFHGEKTPSFHVHPAKGFYYCFGCQAKGDAITFVMETERLEFPDAVAYLGRLAGVTVPMRKRGTRVERARETRTSEALAAAAELFHAELARSPTAQALLARRGVTLDEARELGLGAAPEGWEVLRLALQDRFPEETLVAAGLVTKSLETGRVYDRFRNRLTIEIRDGRGEILGFGARALGDEQPKYLNSPETSRFSKGKLLYGLDRAKEAMRKTSVAILVEGYFDRFAFAKAGLENAVASMGTALTTPQTDLLSRHASTIVVAYDGDPPGIAAALKAFPLLVAHGVSVRHLLLPDGHDPDSYLTAHGPEALRQRVDEALPLVEALAARIPRNLPPEERAIRAGEAVDILTISPDRILRHEFLVTFSRLVDIPLAVLKLRGKKPPSSTVQEKAGPAQESRLPEGEEKVLSVLLLEWPQSRELVDRLPPDVFTHPHSREVLEALKTMDPARALDFSQLQSHLGGGAGLVLARLLLETPDSSEVRGAGSEEKSGPQGLLRLRKPLLQMKIRQLEGKAIELQSQIQSAESSPEGPRESLLRDKQALSADIRRLKQELRRPA